MCHPAPASAPCVPTQTMAPAATTLSAKKASRPHTTARCSPSASHGCGRPSEATMAAYAASQAPLTAKSTAPASANASEDRCHRTPSQCIDGMSAPGDCKPTGGGQGSLVLPARGRLRRSKGVAGCRQKKRVGKREVTRHSGAYGSFPLEDLPRGSACMPVCSLVALLKTGG